MRVLLVDFSAVWWRHSFATEDQAEAKANALIDIDRMANGYDRCAVAFDSYPTWRHETFEAYKAERSEKPHGALDQMRACAIDAGLHYPTFKVDRMEGDDVIGALAKSLRAEHAVTIYSADKDLLQLCDHGVAIISTQTGEVRDADWLGATWGIEPGRVPDFLALVGDKSDGLPGVHRCGPKLAAILLGAFGCLEAIGDALAHNVTGLRELPGVGAATVAALEDAFRRDREPTVFRVRELATLKTDLDLDVGELLAGKSLTVVNPDDPLGLGDDLDEAPPEPQPAPAPLTQADGDNDNTTDEEETMGSNAIVRAEPVTTMVRGGGPPAFTHEQIELMKRTVAEGTNNDEFALFLATAKRRGLDPFARQICAVMRFDKRARRKVMTIQVTIDGFRLIAQRTGQYAGQRGPMWCGADGIWKDVWLSEKAPLAAKVGVMRRGFSEPLWSVANWSSYAETTREGGLTNMWRKFGPHMLAKCAEALALRRAFPEDLSGLYVQEEMMQADEGMGHSSGSEAVCEQLIASLRQAADRGAWYREHSGEIALLEEKHKSQVRAVFKELKDADSTRGQRREGAAPEAVHEGEVVDRDWVVEDEHGHVSPEEEPTDEQLSGDAAE